MAWVAIMAFASLIVAVTVLAIVVIWLAIPGRGDDWAGESEARDDAPAATVEPEVDYSAASPGPHYHLVLLNDETHSFNFVVRMFQDVFSMPLERSVALTLEIHSRGRGVAFRGSLDAVNHKRTQVLEYGPDPSLPYSEEPLGVAIEKAS
jgi:ATP-dependent Clp protease adaptor protein ClpS